MIYNSNSLTNGTKLVRANQLVMIANTPKGRGIFACADITKGSILEVSPVLVLDPRQNEKHVRQTELYNYTYNWPYKDTKPANRGSGDNERPSMTQAVVFGLGSLFNHSRRAQNVGWTRDVENQVITYRTLRDVNAGEELCISYGDRLTFVDSDLEALDDTDDEEELCRIEISP